jgi:hypothetical protein
MGDKRTMLIGGAVITSIFVGGLFFCKKYIKIAKRDSNEHVQQAIKREITKLENKIKESLLRLGVNLEEFEKTFGNDIFKGAQDFIETVKKTGAHSEIIADFEKRIAALGAAISVLRKQQTKPQ